MAKEKALGSVSWPSARFSAGDWQTASPQEMLETEKGRLESEKLQWTQAQNAQIVGKKPQTLRSEKRWLKA